MLSFVFKNINTQPSIKMLRIFICYALLVFVYFMPNVTANRNKYSQFCKDMDHKRRSLSCSTQFTGQQPVESDICQVEHYASDSAECKNINFGPIRTNSQIGGVSLKPYLLDQGYVSSNFTVLNITFTNIKWKRMKFRFQPRNYQKNHCRDIVLSNNFTVDAHSVLYYDCYWSITDGDYHNTSHILDFVAVDDSTENRGQYYFNIPNNQMLSPYVTENEWKPFLYVEILSSTLRLHIMPPPAQVKIYGYKINVRKGCGKGIEDCHDELVLTTNISIKNYTEEAMTDYYYIGNSGLLYFVVTPLHDHCSGTESTCQVVTSPTITINAEQQNLSICIASVAGLIVSALFAYYLMLRCIRRYWCKDYMRTSGQEIPNPPKVLVIYPSANRLHAECVMSFVSYLRSEYGFDVMYEGDIMTSTVDGDPYKWAVEAVKVATHVLYMVGPAKEVNFNINLCEKPINGAHKDVDILLLRHLKSYLGSQTPKDISNVHFKHSDGTVPIETCHGRKFRLLDDWQKLISHLSKNMLPRKQIMRTEKGRSFIEYLNKAEKLLDSVREKEKMLV